MVMDNQEEMLDLLSQAIAKASMAKRRVLDFQMLIVLDRLDKEKRGHAYVPLLRGFRG